jgi:hypothetical protein
MVSEKVEAAIEAGSMLVNGRRPAEIIDFTANKSQRTPLGCPSWSKTNEKPGRNAGLIANSSNIGNVEAARAS